MSGKTTTGKLLAEKLGWRFIDTDELIQEAHGMSCRDLFRQRGEAFFRQAEREVIAASCDVNHSVMSIGGGALTIQENVSVLQERGQIVYLQVSLPTLLHRMKSIPAFLDPENLESSLQKLIDERSAQYETAANHRIICDDMAPEEIASTIFTSVRME